MKIYVKKQQNIFGLVKRNFNRTIVHLIDNDNNEYKTRNTRIPKIIL